MHAMERAMDLRRFRDGLEKGALQFAHEGAAAFVHSDPDPRQDGLDYRAR